MSIRILCLILACSSLMAAERINHAGRRLGPPPVVKTVIPFNTPEADAVLAAMQIMPPDSPWNEDISARPLLPDSAAIMERIRADLPGRTTLRVFPEMNFILVPDNQPLVPIRFTEYPDESDYHGGKPPVATWPIPSGLPVECWPSGRPVGEALARWQKDPESVGGDRHAIVVQPGRMQIFETWQTRLGDGGWESSCGAIFSLAQDKPRPAGWTSADAAGLPMFPALVRYDECERGTIEHALRIVVKRTRREYLAPATHFASTVKAGDPAAKTCPAMGQRVRLRADVEIPANWSKQSKAVAQALKTYGALVADNGGFFSVSCTPDQRFPEGCFDQVQKLDITSFEVVSMEGPAVKPKQARKRE